MCSTVHQIVSVHVYVLLEGLLFDGPAKVDRVAKIAEADHSVEVRLGDVMVVRVDGRSKGKGRGVVVL